jgi:hypothetical protein
MEKSARILPSNKTALINQMTIFAPVAPPATVGSS